MGLLTYGYDSAFIGTTITQKSFMRDFGLDTMSKAQQNAVSSNLTSICEPALFRFLLACTDFAVANRNCPDSAGGFFGALFMFASMELLGRKLTVIISDAIFILGA